MKRYLYILIILFAISGCNFDGMLNPSEGLTQLASIDISIEHEDYLDLLNNRSLNKSVACRVRYKDQLYHGMIRASGAGSRYYFKWSYRIELEAGELIEGVNEFNLSAQVEDPSMIRSAVASRLFSLTGFTSFKSMHLFLRINDSDEGMYTFAETVNEHFFERREMPVYELYKLGFGSSFSFSPLNHPEFVFNKQIPDDGHYTNLLELINAIDTCNLESGNNSLNRYLDLDNYIRYHAISSIIAHIDGFTNNYYLYKKNDSSPFSIIPWDYDKCFWDKESFGIVGDNDIIRKIFTNTQLFEEYKSVMQSQLNELLREDFLFPIIDSAAAYISEGYNLDTYLGRGNKSLSIEVDNLKNFIRERKIYLEENLQSLDQNYFER